MPWAAWGVWVHTHMIPGRHFTAIACLWYQISRYAGWPPVVVPYYTLQMVAILKHWCSTQAPPREQTQELFGMEIGSLDVSLFFPHVLSHCKKTSKRAAACRYKTQLSRDADTVAQGHSCTCCANECHRAANGKGSARCAEHPKDRQATVRPTCCMPIIALFPRSR